MSLATWPIDDDTAEPEPAHPAWSVDATPRRATANVDTTGMQDDDIDW